MDLIPKGKARYLYCRQGKENQMGCFYTDIDSIRVKVKPGTKYNFEILLNGKYSCYTQITSAIAPNNGQQIKNTKNDTTPFTLSAYNAIGEQTVINVTDTFKPAF